MNCSFPTSILAIVMCAAVTGAHAEMAELTAANAYARMQRGALILIDVRAEKDWRRTGLPQGAIPITADQPRSTFVERVAQTTKGDKSRPIALICNIGVKSAEMQEVLDLAGYAKVINIAEGISGNNAGPGWLTRGLPMRDIGR